MMLLPPEIYQYTSPIYSCKLILTTPVTEYFFILSAEWVSSNMPDQIAFNQLRLYWRNYLRNTILFSINIPSMKWYKILRKKNDLYSVVNKTKEASFSSKHFRHDLLEDKVKNKICCQSHSYIKSRKVKT